MNDNEISQLLEIINDNEENYVFTESDWVVKTVAEIIKEHEINTINIYGANEVDSLKDDVSLLGSEITIDVDNAFTTARTSKLELYVKDDKQYLGFEVENTASFNYRDTNIEIFKDSKESDEIDFDETSDFIILVTDYIYTSDRGLDIKKRLGVYIPFNMREVLDEEGASY